MTGPRLIFVEGMTGAGKSSTAAHIAEWLEARGERARAYHEMADDNPVRTRGVDRMRANHPQRAPLPDVGPDGLARDPSVYDVGQWGVLARGCREGDTAVILESRYMQNSVQPRFSAGAPRAKVIEGFATIAEQVSPAAPLLVYLRPSDVAQAVDRVLAERGEPWAPWLLETFSGFPWARERKLSGRAAVVAYYEAWEEVAAELCEMHRGPLLRIVDPQADWAASLERIYAALRSGGS